MNDGCCAAPPRSGGYLSTLPLAAAQGRLLERIAPLGEVETVDVDEAGGRVTAAPVFARISAPHYPAAAMDGIAVRAEATSEASQARPLRLKEGSGYAVVDTGDPVPAPFDAVIMVEEIHPVAPGEVEILQAAAPRHHVRMVGEDVVAGELVFPRGQRLRPFDLQALLASGNTEVAVVRRPVVGIVPSGDEVIEPGAPLAPGAVIESNSRMLAALAREEGAVARRYPICPDDPAALERAVRGALADCDLVVVIAGSSAGRGDFTAQVFGRIGELVAHGVAIMPGKPCAFGWAQGQPVLGVPGYPVSAALVADLFLRPALARLQGAVAQERPRARARLLRKLASRLGHEEFVRVTLGRVRGQLVAVPLRRGAGAITTLTRAQAILRVGPLLEGLEAGSEVEVELLQPAEQVENTVLCVGSHDPAIDLLGDLLAARWPGMRLASASVGSLGGLLAVAAGEAHLAGSHLLDPATGEYNLPDLARHASGAKLAVFTLAHRAQGLLVAPGNPKALRGLEDLTRADLTFVNRQRGSGTRVLLDYELARRGLQASAIRGYHREEFTHAAVAVAVRSGAADAGVAVLAAARALGVDFVPLAEERYDLVVPLDLLEDPRVARVLDTIQTARFRAALRALGGYDDRETGRRVV